MYVHEIFCAPLSANTSTQRGQLPVTYQMPPAPLMAQPTAYGWPGILAATANMPAFLLGPPYSFNKSSVI